MSGSVASDALAAWIEERIAQGFEPWFLTYMFHPLSGSSGARVQQMLQIVEQIYRIRLTRLIRQPRAASNHKRRPILLAGPDRPIFKHIKQNLKDVTLNDGDHVHSIILESLERRCKSSLAEFAWEQADLIHRLCPSLMRLDVRAITHDVPRVTSYVFKQVEKRFAADDILILPRTNQELRKGSLVGRQSSIFAPAAAAAASQQPRQRIRRRFGSPSSRTNRFLSGPPMPRTE